MPQLANIAITKADGTTAVTWNGDVASSGDRSPAKFSSKSVSSIPAFQPKMQVSSEGSPDGAVRRIKVNAVWPYSVLDTTTNRTSEVARMSFQGQWNVSQEIPSATVDEFASQIAKLIASTLMVDTVKQQQAPT